MTAFFIDCPAKNTMTAIELVADAMQHVKFEPAEFARELKVVRRELADGEVEPPARAVEAACSRRSTRRIPPGIRSSATSTCSTRTTNQTIIDFYHERYVPNNQVFVVVGDVKTQQVLDEVAKQYAGTPRGRETYVPFEDEPEQLSPREAVREMDGADLRHGVRLADGEALAPRPVRAGRGGVHPRRGRKLAAGRSG